MMAKHEGTIFLRDQPIIVIAMCDLVVATTFSVFMIQVMIKWENRIADGS
jgi:hypothetical protein